MGGKAKASQRYLALPEHLLLGPNELIRTVPISLKRTLSLGKDKELRSHKLQEQASHPGGLTGSSHDSTDDSTTNGWYPQTYEPSSAQSNYILSFISIHLCRVGALFHFTEEKAEVQLMGDEPGLTQDPEFLSTILKKGPD